MTRRATSSRVNLPTRLRGAGRWIRPVLGSPRFWLGLLILIVSLLALYALFNRVVMPLYTRQGVEVHVPEVREMPYDQAVDLVEERGLRAERREQPFNPAHEREAVLDQNPDANATVKPGRRIYLYVNSGTERRVSMPEVRTLTELVARAELAELGLMNVEIRVDEAPSPYSGTVTRQEPRAGVTLGTSEPVVIWVSRGMGDATVEVPDVRGGSFEEAQVILENVGLWVDPTRAISGIVTRQEPAAGSMAREGAEVRLSSAPIEEDSLEDPDDAGYDEYPEGIPPDTSEPPPSPEEPTRERDAGRIDW